MKKRLISICLALTIMVSLCGALPQYAAAADSVERQIRAFADTLDKSDASSSAAATLAMHGMTKNGRKLTLGKGDALTAVLFNSELMQYGLVQLLTDTMQCIQQLDMQSVPGLRTSLDWGGRSEHYSAYILTEGTGVDRLDWMCNEQTYTGKWNAYDEALEWMVGNCEVDAVLTCIGESATEKTYRVKVTASDRFDFSTASSSGFKKLMSGVGMILFEEFDWSSTVTFDVTMPYSYDSCSHSSGAYRWVYDAESRTMRSDGGNGYTQNNTVHRTAVAANGKTQHYYALEHTVRLDHRKPWVLEYDVCRPVGVSFHPVETAAAKTYPLIRQSGGQSVYVISKDYAMAPGADGQPDRYYAYNYYGTQLSALFPYSAKKNYTFRLENIITADGSMVYLTVTERDSGAVCAERVPMDDYYYYGGWMDSTELRSKSNPWVSGKDFYINYIGNAAYGLEAGSLEIRVWENGKDGGDGSYLSSRETKATCTKQGSTTHVCTRCGYTYTDSYTQPLGHSFGAWARTTAPTCIGQGEERRSCGVCGESEVRALAALGHTLTKHAAQAASCTAEGWNDYESCSRCDYTTFQAVAATGHTYTDTVTAPTCTEQGSTTHTCHCGDTYTDSYTEAIGHTFVNGCCERCGAEAPALPFCDVAVTDYFHAPVLWAVEHGVTAGVAEDLFAPGQDCTRGQVVTFLWRAAGEPKAADRSNPFYDVQEADYYYEAVLWAVEQGITSGVSADSFAPDTSCTRGQIVTFLHRAMGKPDAASSENPFRDVDSVQYYYAPVLWAVEHHITSGVGEGSFAPDATCTRGQAVTFLYRAYK